MHTLMNPGWHLWDLADHPASGWLVITPRVGVVTIAITATVIGRRRGWWDLRLTVARAA